MPFDVILIDILKMNKEHTLLPVAAIIIISAIVLAFLFGLGGCGEKKVGGKMKVAASIVPLADLCRNVGGDLVEVDVMVPPGASPHTYEPTSEQMKFLSDAGVFVYNGLGLETWITEIIKKVDNPGLVEVAVAENVPESDLIKAAGEHEDGHEEENGHGNGIYDPHVWLDPRLAVFEVEAIRDGFIEADPDNEEIYRKNAEAYIADLEDLDEYIQEETSTFTKRKFVSFHPSFTYFARRYGLEQVGAIEELPGKEPSSSEIAELIDEIRAQGVEVIFIEPQLNPQVAEAIAEESGADVVLEVLDPLGDPDNPQTDTYVKLMQYNVGVMAEAMK